MISPHVTRAWFWRVPAWAVVAAVTALAAPSLPRQVAAGVAMAVAALPLILLGDEHSARATTAGVVLATVLGLAAVLLAPRGLGEVLPFVAATRIALPIDRGAGRAFLVVDALAVSAAVGYVSRSLVGLLAGLGIPLLAQRAAERRALLAARDEAQALLVEVQAGRDAEAQAAALRERGRIARDLHDVLAHSLAGLSVQLQATRAVAARRQVDRSVLDPLDKAAALAREGLAEARAVVGALRDPGGLGMAELPSLVERQPGDVTLQVTGTPAAVAPEVGHCVYRAVQEALTNAARYAPGAPVTVTVEHGGDGLGVSVTDTGLPAGRSAVPSLGSGLGLAGMDERVRAVGGTLTAGPPPAGGWRVEIRVPTAAVAPA